MTEEHLLNEFKPYALTTVWESYEIDNEYVCAFKTEELAKNHDLFEVGHISKTEILLTEEQQERLNEGRAVWL